MKKLKAIIGVLASSLMLGAAVGVSSIQNNQQAQPVEAATTTYTGSIGFEFQYLSGWNYYWDDASAKIACYIWKGSSNGWTTMITGDGSHHASIPYSLSFDPFGATMNIVRFNSAHSDTPDWNDIWARVDNVTFGQVVYIYGSNQGSASATHTSPTFLGFNSYGSSDQVTNRLSETKYNSSSHFEFYKTGLTITQYDYGKVALDGSEWCNGINSAVSSDYFYIDNEYYEKNMVCHYYGDSYDIYFDVSNKNSYFTIPDRAVAEKWGDTFLSTVTCSGGSTAPSTTAWGTTMKNAYNALTTGQQGEIWKLPAQASGTFLEEAVYRYDYIIHKYGKTRYADFVGRTNTGGGYAMGSIQIPLFEMIGNNDSGSATLIVIIVSLVSVTAIGGYFFLRKRKQDR